MRSCPAILAACLLATGAGAIAQPVFRCGNSYSPQPCEGGSMVAAPAAAPGKADADRAAAAAKVDAQRARELEKARLAQEKNAPRAIVIAAPAAPAASSKPAPALRKPQEFKATAVVARVPEKAKKKEEKKEERKAGGK
jgi:hypothetical protein